MEHTMEYRIEYDFAKRGAWGGDITVSIAIPLVYEEKRTKRLALKTYKSVKRLYGRQLSAVRLYDSKNMMIKGERYGRR